MQIKETPDLWVVQEKRRLRIPDVEACAAEYAAKIEADIEEAGLETDGPWIFVSHDLPRDGKTFFDWAICRPIKRPEHYEGKLGLIHLEPIIVASRVHRGSLRTLFTKGYAPLVAEIDRSSHVYSGESREVYHSWSGAGAAHHNIEIQFGLVS